MFQFLRIPLPTASFNQCVFLYPSSQNTPVLKAHISFLLTFLLNYRIKIYQNTTLPHFIRKITVFLRKGSCAMLSFFL